MKRLGWWCESTRYFKQSGRKVEVDRSSFDFWSDESISSKFFFVLTNLFQFYLTIRQAYLEKTGPFSRLGDRNLLAASPTPRDVSVERRDAVDPLFLFYLLNVRRRFLEWNRRGYSGLLRPNVEGQNRLHISIFDET